MIEKKINQIIIEPRFCEIDSLKIVHHSRYVAWYEESYFNFLQNVIGLSKKYLLNLGIYNPIASLNCNYKQSVRWNDIVLITTRMNYSSLAYFVMEHKLTTLANPQKVIATANIKHIFTDSNLKLMISTPEKYLSLIEHSVNKHPQCFTKYE